MNTDQLSAAAIIRRVAEALVVLDRNGRCTYLNRHAEELLGKPPEALVGRVFWEAVPELAESQLVETVRKAIERQRPQGFEEQIEQLGGWWAYRLFPASDGVSVYFTNINEQKHREESLKLCVESYSQLIHSLGGAVWVADGGTFNYLYVSDQAAHLLGYPISQWLEEPDFWRTHLHPDDRQRCIDLRLQALAYRKDILLEYRMIAADQREVWIREIASRHISNASGTIRLRGIMLEITEQKRIEEERLLLLNDLQERIKEFRVLAEAASLLQGRVENLREVLCNLAFLLPAAFQFPESTAARVCIGEVCEATPNFRETEDTLIGECRCIGELVCRVEIVYLEEFPVSDIGPFSMEEQVLVQLIADLLRLAEERKQCLEALEQREDLFRTMVQGSRDSVTILSADGRFVYQSPAIERIAGVSPEKLIGRQALDVIHPDDHLVWREFLQKLLGQADARPLIEYRCLNADGTWRMVESTGQRIMDEQGRLAVVINTRDVTERNEVKRRLRESEKRFRLLFEKNAAGMVICDTDGQILQVNPAFCRLLGYTEGELSEKTVFEIIHPDDRAQSRRGLENMQENQQAVELDKRYIRRGGGIVWARTSSIPFTSEGGTLRYIATIQDITAAKAAAEALKIGEQRYRSLLLASAQVVWITDDHGTLLPDNSSWNVFTGQTLEESRSWGWLMAVHPEDRERVARQWTHALKRHTVYETEMRVRTIEGEYRHMAVRGAPVKEDGHIREWVGTCTDITDRKRVEADLLTWKQRYDAAVRASGQLLYEWNMSTDEVAYGGSLEAILGYTPAEIAVTGGEVRRWTDLIHPEDRERFLKKVEVVRRTREPFHIQYRLRHKSGSYRIVQDHGQSYRDERGDGFRQVGFISDITEQVEMEQRLRASEERFRRIFEECGVGMMVMDLEQHILQVNSAYCRFVGYSEEELCTIRERDLVCPDDLPEYDRRIEEVLRGRSRVLDMDKRCIRKDGQIVWAHLTGVFPSVGGKPAYCVAVIQDLTARKQAEEEVKRTERFYRSLIENSSDNITVLNSKGITVFQSPAIEKQLGYAPEELVGRNNAGLLHPEDRSKATRRLLETLRRGETSKPQALRFRNKDGSWRVLETVGRRFTDNTGRTVGIFNTRDVTERVIAGELLQRAKHQAESANLAKDRFLASLSHELRTPLTPVIALLPELLQEPGIPEHVKSDLWMIKQNVELETRLIDDLLDLTRITQGKVRLNRQKIDVHELIRSTLEIVHSDLVVKQMHVELDLLACKHHAWGDRVRLQQVFWNLFKNAIKFSPAGSSIFLKTVNPTDEQIRISVCDEGAGIEPEQLSQIFDAFVQTLAGSGHQFGGLGLGLFISRAMVEQHDGTIEAESAGLGKGSTFHVNLAAVPEGAMPDIERPVTTRGRPSSPLRILLVEDHAHTREVLSRLLKRQGHTVLPAETVEEALHVADENPVDVAISDLGLPDGSGLDLMPKLRSRYGVKGIAVSGYGMEGDLKNSREAGFGAHLVKPIDFKQLQSALQEVVASSQENNAKRPEE